MTTLITHNARRERTGNDTQGFITSRENVPKFHPSLHFFYKKSMK
jgi:hypothetical protein